MTEPMERKGPVPDAIRAEMMTCPDCGPQAKMRLDGTEVVVCVETMSGILCG